MNKEENIFSFNFSDIIKFVYKWRKHLLIIGGLALILSAVFTSPRFITPKYRSTVEFFPTTINSIANAMFTDLNQREADPLDYGEEEEAEKALQILKSDMLIKRVVRNFDLMNHYKIKSDEKYPYTKLMRKIDKNISFNKTRHLSINISVMDADPNTAAEIANGISQVYDSVKTEIQQKLARELYVIVEDEFKNKQAEVWKLKNKLRALGQKGIIDVAEQSNAISTELYKLEAQGGNSDRVQRLRSERDTLAKYGNAYTEAYETLLLELDEYSQLNKRYRKAKVDVERHVSHMHVFSHAFAAEKKSYPIRKLMVLGITFLTVLVTLVFLLIVEQKDKFSKLTA
jgi:uncharacterized protein involved in exopolysaccharide biosynthesis